MFRTPCWVETRGAGRIGAAEGIGCRVVFADFSSRSPEKSFAKIAALSKISFREVIFYQILNPSKQPSFPQILWKTLSQATPYNRKRVAPPPFLVSKPDKLHKNFMECSKAAILQNLRILLLPTQR
jgi:hypothetical protein